MEMTDTPGEAIAAQIDGAIESAEARVEAAEAVNEALTEAAIRDRLSGRIDDCEEGISSCQNDQEELANDLQALEITNNLQSQQIAMLMGTITTLGEQVTALTASQLHSTPRPTPGENSPPLDQSQTPVTPESQQNEGEGDHGEAEPEPENKPKRGRLI
jgi:chromosome segregation ATPase